MASLLYALGLCGRFNCCRESPVEAFDHDNRMLYTSITSAHPVEEIEDRLNQWQYVFPLRMTA